MFHYSILQGYIDIIVFHPDKYENLINFGIENGTKLTALFQMSNVNTLLMSVSNLMAANLRIPSASFPLP